MWTLKLWIFCMRIYFVLIKAKQLTSTQYLLSIIRHWFAVTKNLNSPLSIRSSDCMPTEWCRCLRNRLDQKMIVQSMTILLQCIHTTVAIQVHKPLFVQYSVLCLPFVFLISICVKLDKLISLRLGSKKSINTYLHRYLTLQIRHQQQQSNQLI